MVFNSVKKLPTVSWIPGTLFISSVGIEFCSFDVGSLGKTILFWKVVSDLSFIFIFETDWFSCNLWLINDLFVEVLKLEILYFSCFLDLWVLIIFEGLLVRLVFNILEWLVDNLVISFNWY